MVERKEKFQSRDKGAGKDNPAAHNTNSKGIGCEASFVVKCIPSTVTYDKIEEICSKFGKLDTFVKHPNGCTYSFLNFTTLSSIDDFLNAITHIGVSCTLTSRCSKRLGASGGNTGQLNVGTGETGRNHGVKSAETSENFRNNMSSRASVGSNAGMLQKPRNQNGNAFQNNTHNSIVGEHHNRGHHNQRPSHGRQVMIPSRKNAPCIYCQEVTDLKCCRCGDFYCSIECQTRDWSSHRYICFKMPELIKTDDIGIAFEVPAEIVAAKEVIKKIESVREDDSAMVPKEPRVNKALNFRTKQIAQSATNPPLSTMSENTEKPARINPFKSNPTEKVVIPPANSATRKPQRNQQNTKSSIKIENSQAAKPPTPELKSFAPLNTSSIKNNISGSISSFTIEEIPDIKMPINANKPPSRTNSLVNSPIATSSNSKPLVNSPIAASSNSKPLVNSPIAASNYPKHSSASCVSVGSRRASQNINDDTISCASSTISVASTNLIGPVEFPRMGCIVTITSVLSVERINIRSLDKHADRNYNKIIQTVDELSSSGRPLKQLPENNTYAVAEFNNDGIFCRVLVVNVKNANEILVAFIDFGNLQTKQLCDLRDLPDSCRSLSRYVFPIDLMNIPKSGNVPEMLDYLKTFELNGSKQFQIYYEKVDKVTKCRLISKSSLVDLNNKMIEISAKPYSSRNQNNTGAVPKNGTHFNANDAKDHPENLSDRVLEAPFETISFTLNQKVRILIINNSTFEFGYFAACLFQDYPDIENLNLNIVKEFGQKASEPYEPICNEYCLVNSKKDSDVPYLRAKVQKCLPHKKFQVYLVDFGLDEIVDFVNIRKYPKELTEPCRTKLISLSDLPDEIPKTLANRLMELLPVNGMKVLTKVNDINGDFIFADIEDVMKKLQDEQLI